MFTCHTYMGISHWSETETMIHLHQSVLTNSYLARLSSLSCTQYPRDSNVLMPLAFSILTIYCADQNHSEPARQCQSVSTLSKFYPFCLFVLLCIAKTLYLFRELFFTELIQHVELLRENYIVLETNSSKFNSENMSWLRYFHISY